MMGESAICAVRRPVVPPTEAAGARRVARGFSPCPFLEPARPDWIYPVAGYCRGVRRGWLMLPSVDEYRTWCSTPDHPACPIFRARRGQEDLT